MEQLKEDKPVRVCKICGINEHTTKFQQYKRTCIKCNSKKCNEKILMKDPSYFNNKVKARYIKHGKVGRPKQIIEITL
jgi:hypothetical protein